MSTILEDLTNNVDAVVESLTWAGLAYDLVQEHNDDEVTATRTDGDIVFRDADGDEIDADDAYRIVNPYDAPAAAWLDRQLEARVHGSRALGDEDMMWETVSVTCTIGGPNIFADWDGSRWHVHGHWGSDEVHRYVSGDDLGVGEYLSDLAEC